MFNRFLVLFLCCFLMLSFCFPVFASSTFSSNIPQIESYTDINGLKHDYFAVFNDSIGYLFELIYDSSLSRYYTSIYPTYLTFTFARSGSSSSVLSFSVVVRNLSSGALLNRSSYSLSSSSSSINATFNSSSFFVGISLMNYYDNISSAPLYVHPDTSISLGSVTFISSLIDNYIVSYLSEPVSDAVNKFVVLSNGSTAYILMFSDFSQGSVQFDFIVNEDGSFSFRADNTSSASVDFTLTSYQVNTGFLSTYSTYSLSPNQIYFHAFSNDFFDFPFLKTYGVNFNLKSSTYLPSLPLIQWNSDYSISAVIATSSLLVVNQLRSLNTSINDLNSNLLYISSTLDQIYSLLNSIYNSDSSFQPTQPSYDAIQDYDNLESSIFNSLNNNLDSNLVDVFDSSNIVSNNAFGFIRSFLQASVLDNSKLNSFVFFGLTIGLAVMIIGRKLND